MSETTPICSIVIRCYNEEQYIGRLLSGIMAQTVKDIEIILVDSGSTDATVSIAKRYPVKVLHISKDEFSFGRSLNIGCQESIGKYLVFASAHVYPVYKDWLEQLIKPFENDKVGLVYGKQRGDETTKYSESRIFSHWFPEESNFQQDHPFCNNANVAIRREIWETYSYNEELTGLEDLEWGNRIISDGFLLAYNADATIIHVHNEKPLQIYNRYRREANAFKRIFPLETFGLRRFFTTWILNVLSDYGHTIQDKVLYRELISIPYFRFLQFWGTYRGYAQHKPLSKKLRRRFYYPDYQRRKTEDRDTLRIHYASQNTHEN